MYLGITGWHPYYVLTIALPPWCLLDVYIQIIVVLHPDAYTKMNIDDYILK